ncbi:hypothetical protein [Paractinoplanes atraurantiacus]|uniref:Uncharacterized protein n=1 Tax=Paractinoplanes atraurantiacus TaxID=1036182 RepID=A0A285J4X7_9ACTN|nr:hypothetical protein [Actinoplanes atraurantiacus]SNY55334.1 hypothetical protein SAMN05421748_116115 [Actinoplanes atraurantiacus]
MRITEGDGTWTVTAAEYVLHVRVPELVAVLADPDGRIWSRLSLLASVDRADAPDDSYGRPRVTLRTEPLDAAAGPRVAEFDVAMASPAWEAKSVLFRCFEDRVEVRARVRGSGPLGEVRLLGGRATLPDGACGVFRSSIEFTTLFVPTPAEPVRAERPADSAASLGIVGDACAGRLNAVFSPPPLCLVFQRPGGGVLSAGLAGDVRDLRFPALRYDPLDGGFLLVADYEGRTRAGGVFETPRVVLRRAAGPWQALQRHREDVAPARDPGERPAWWREPIFCGWGAQCAAAPIPGQPTSHPYHLRDLGPAVVPAGVTTAFEMSRRDRYDGWLARLARHGVVPGTVVVDDRWQLAYGTGEPDGSRWPGLREWIAERHAAGQRVLLWWKAWDPAGLPADECVTDPAGTPVAADPGSPAYRDRLAGIVRRLLGPDGLDADGFKIDFTQRAPSGRALRRPGAPPGAPWGIALLHLMLATIHRAAKSAKPGALVVTHAPHPGFGDVSDMIRLNDILERDPAGAEVPAVDQLAFRHAVVRACLPDHLIDTDQWPIADRAQWRAYVEAQARLGVPALYYAERLDRSGEALTGDDLRLVARTWESYRANPL